MPAETIDPSTARRLQSREPDVRLVDVRSAGEFAGVRIAGSRNVPLETVEDWAREETASADGPVVLVCGSGVRATRAAASLEAAGFPSVAVLAGGLKAWTAAGLPVETGPGGAISIERQVRIAAGSLVVLGILLAWAATPYAALLSLFVGAGLVFAGVTDTCGMGLLLARAPWNRAGRG